jgi:hypothetical protein
MLMWCRHCHLYHKHGVGPGSNNWHRVAHCHDQASPYDSIGYTLVDAGPAPLELLLDHEREQSLGPETWQRECRW